MQGLRWLAYTGAEACQRAGSPTRVNRLAIDRAEAIAASTWRGGIVENRHVAHIAVTDASGQLLYQFGQPSRMTLARSAAKPAQALAIIESGALERFGFDEADLALMCASHSSEARHIELARTMLAKANASERDLRCGGHPSLSDAVQRAWIQQDFSPGPLCSNCSGKHIGMLAAAQAIGAPMEGYHLPDHPVQVRVMRTLSEVCDLPMGGVLWAVDGCNLPTPAFPLDRLARFYAMLADAADAADAEDAKVAKVANAANVAARAADAVDAPDAEDAKVAAAAADLAAGQASRVGRTSAMARVYRAMTRHPELVAGTGRFCSVLMTAFDGALVGKVGADASYAIGVRASEQTARLGARGALGIAIKVEDGNTGILYALVCEVLAQLDLGGAPQRAALLPFHTPRLRNTMDVETGHLAFDFVLRAGTAARSAPQAPSASISS